MTKEHKTKQGPMSQQQTTERELLEALKKSIQILNGHQKLIDGLFRIQGYHQAIFNAQLQGEALDPSTRSSIEQAQSVTTEISELHRLFSLDADQPGENG